MQKALRKRPGQCAQQLADLMQFTEFINLFKSVERLIWFKGVDGRERDGEHVFQVAITCWFAIERFGLGLDPFKTMVYALVHDLVEAYADDTPAFRKNGDGCAETPCRIEKQARERASMERIRREWGEKFPSLVAHLDAYEAQADEESRFVYAMDKFVAEMNVVQDGGRANKLLGVDIETLDLYKRPRIARHPFVLALYEEHFKILLANRDTLFAKTEDPP